MSETAKIPLVIKQFAREAYLLARAKGFHNNDPIDLKLNEYYWVERIAIFVANLHGEISELWEAAREGKLLDLCDKKCNLTCVEEELADIVIRVLDMAETLGVDIERAVRVKHEYNTERAHMHGKLA